MGKFDRPEIREAMTVPNAALLITKEPLDGLSHGYGGYPIVSRIETDNLPVSKRTAP